MLFTFLALPVGSGFGICFGAGLLDHPNTAQWASVWMRQVSRQHEGRSRCYIQLPVEDLGPADLQGILDRIVTPERAGVKRWVLSWHEIWWCLNQMVSSLKRALNAHSELWVFVGPGDVVCSGYNLSCLHLILFTWSQLGRAKVRFMIMDAISSQQRLVFVGELFFLNLGLTFLFP